MTPTLREILHMYLRQKRHDFHWQQIFLTVYFGGLYVAVLLAFYFGAREELAAHPVPAAVVIFVPLAAITAQRPADEAVLASLSRGNGRLSAHAACLAP